jgi:two-component system sensor histidine kinase FlrB
MLPTSHPALINPPLTSIRHEEVDPSLEENLLVEEGESGDDAETAPADQAAVLAEAFSEFIRTSARLEKSYRELQAEVHGLGQELAERNAALNRSLAENQRMRLALEQIVGSMPCGVMVVEREGAITMMNPETGRLLGIGGAERPSTLREMAAQSGVYLEKVFAGLAEEAAQEFCVQGESGKRWVEVRNRQVFHSPEREAGPDQTILILRDVTAQKRAENARESGRNALALTEVTTMLAHEIRNPLASLELFAELIELDGERRAEWISNLRAGIRSLSGTVNNVLSLHTAGVLKLVPMPLAALVTHAIEFMRPLADQAGILIEWWDRDCPLLVKGNDAAIQQVMLNLLTNAIRHTPASGAITVTMELLPDEFAGEWVAVDVSDTGCGVRRDQMARLFEAGFSGNGESSGLGLAVCERLMKQHGGRISVMNLVDSGARFRLEFPALRLEMVNA